MEPKDIIKTAREGKGLTQAQLADIVEVSDRMIQRYEEGKFPKFKSEKIKRLDEILGTKIYDIIYDTKTSLEDPYIERLIEQIEARRKDAEENAKKMESHYQDMKAALERAQTTINEVLKPIQAQANEIFVSSKKVQEGLLSLKTEVVAEHGEMMETLDQIAGNEPGTTAAKAGTVELAHQVRKANKDKKANMGKQG